MSTATGDKSPQSPLKPSFVHWEWDVPGTVAVRNEAHLGSEVVQEW